MTDHEPPFLVTYGAEPPDLFQVARRYAEQGKAVEPEQLRAAILRLFDELSIRRGVIKLLSRGIRETEDDEITRLRRALGEAQTRFQQIADGTVDPILAGMCAKNCARALGTTGAPAGRDVLKTLQREES